MTQFRHFMWFAIAFLMINITGLASSLQDIGSNTTSPQSAGLVIRSSDDLATRPKDPAYRPQEWMQPPPFRPYEPYPKFPPIRDHPPQSPTPAWINPKKPRLKFFNPTRVSSNPWRDFVNYALYDDSEKDESEENVPNHDLIDGKVYEPSELSVPIACDPDDISGVPFNVFKNTYQRFCSKVRAMNSINPIDQVDNSYELEPLSWLVDINGNKLPTRKHPRDLGSALTPPPDPSDYEDTTIRLEFTPHWSATRKHPCEISCEVAFTSMVDSPCGHTGTQMSNMANDATLDNACGSYSYSIFNKYDEIPSTYSEDEESSPKLRTATIGRRDCYPLRLWESDYVILPRDQYKWAEDACNSWPDTMGPLDDMLYMDVQAKENFWGVYAIHQYAVEWIPNCNVNGPRQNIQQPVLGDPSTTCVQLMHESFIACGDTNGAGGYIEVGCLRFKFTMPYQTPA